MANVNFTYALKRFFPTLKSCDIEATNVADIIVELEKRYPGLQTYICDDQGMLRQHVNIFINNNLINDRETLSDPVEGEAEIFIMQALSGG